MPLSLSKINQNMRNIEDISEISNAEELDKIFRQEPKEKQDSFKIMSELFYR